MKSIFLLISLAVAVFATAESVEQLGQEVLEFTWQFRPVDATYVGIHKNDTTLGDYRPLVLKRKFKAFKKYLNRLETIDTLTLRIDDYIDYALLKATLKAELFNGETLKVYHHNPLVYVGEAIYAIYNLLIRFSPSSQARAEAMLKRLEKIPAMLDQARENLEELPAIHCEAAIEQLREGAEFFNEIGRIYADSVSPEHRQDFVSAKEKAVVALASFRFFLEGKLYSSQTPFYMGKRRFDYKLKELNLLDMNSDSILSLGRNMLDLTTRLIDSINRVYTRKARRTGIPPDSFGPADVACYRQWEVSEMRRFVGAGGVGYVTVPDYVGDLIVIETPGFLRVLIPGIAMEPAGPFDQSKTSFFYARPIPPQFDSTLTHSYYEQVLDRGFKGSVVHEGYPGHHLQISIANHHPSSIRRNHHDGFLIEGWALYCEELMARSGLHEDTAAAIRSYLGGVKFRAARAVVDVMLQTGQYDYEQAVGFMQQTFGGDRSDSMFFAQEVRRYATEPGQPSSYLVGKMQLLRLRDDYRRLKGMDFSLCEFHDQFLALGSIPFSLIRRKLLGAK